MENIGFPYKPTHPGSVLKEEVNYRKIPQKKFAAMIGVSYTMLNEIFNEKRPVSLEFALAVEAALGISAEMLVNMQNGYNLQIAQQNKDNQKRWQEIRKRAASFF